MCSNAPRRPITQWENKQVEAAFSVLQGCEHMTWIISGDLAAIHEIVKCGEMGKFRDVVSLQDFYFSQTVWYTSPFRAAIFPRGTDFCWLGMSCNFKRILGHHLNCDPAISSSGSNRQTERYVQWLYICLCYMKGNIWFDPSHGPILDAFTICSYNIQPHSRPTIFLV